MSLNKDPIDFMVGTDVEFAFEHDNELIHAAEVLDKDADCGSDQNGRNVEIRSKPSNDPLKVIQSVKDVLKKTAIDNPEFCNWNWVGKSFFKGLPFGLHFHTNLKENVIHPKDICYPLDNYLGAITILLEDKQQGIARRKYNKSPQGNPVQYGGYGDYRKKKYGMEWRSMSTSICSPHIMTAVMCLGKALVYELLNNKSFRFNEYILPDDYINMNQEKIRCSFDSLWHDVTKLSLYRQYEKQLSIIPKLVYSNSSWFPKGDKDIKETWGIVKLDKYINSNKVTLKGIWAGFEPEILKNEPIIKPIIKPLVKAVIRPEIINPNLLNKVNFNKYWYDDVIDDNKEDKQENKVIKPIDTSKAIKINKAPKVNKPKQAIKNNYHFYGQKSIFYNDAWEGGNDE